MRCFRSALTAFRLPVTGHTRAHGGHALACLLVAPLLVPLSALMQESGDVSMIFQRRVDAFMELRQRAREGVAPQHIVDPRIRAIGSALLAARIRELRPHAAEGDVFSAAMSALIQDRLHRAFDPSEIMLSELYSEEFPPWDAVRINRGCAKDVLVTPPVAVLAALPPVPGALGYRVAGRDIVLWDEEAEIVIDVVRDALPKR